MFFDYSVLKYLAHQLIRFNWEKRWSKLETLYYSKTVHIVLSVSAHFADRYEILEKSRKIIIKEKWNELDSNLTSDE